MLLGLFVILEILVWGKKKRETSSIPDCDVLLRLALQLSSPLLSSARGERQLLQMHLAPLAGFASSVAVPWAPLGTAFIVWHFVLPAKGRERGQVVRHCGVPAAGKRVWGVL